MPRNLQLSIILIQLKMEVIFTKFKKMGICGTKIAAKTSNLKCHLARYHKAVHKQVMEEDEPSKPNFPNTGTQQTLSKFFPSEKMTVSMTKQKF